jgi:hypothetical protein
VSMISERFELDLLELVTRDEYAQMPIVVLNGLMDVLCLVLTHELRRQPGDVPAVVATLDRLRARILPTFTTTRSDGDTAEQQRCLTDPNAPSVDPAPLKDQALS